jgi:cell division protein FtsA
LTPTGLRVDGCGTAETRGFRRSEVTDVEALSHCIRAAVDEAELMAQGVVRSGYITIAPKTKRGIANRGSARVQGARVSESDVARVIEAARKPEPSPDEVYLHTLVREFVVDDQEGVEQPIGMHGRQLDALVQIVRVPAQTVSLAARAMERARMQVEGVVLEVIASSYGVLDASEREAGVVVLEMGAATTSLAVWYRGVLVHNATIPVGGDNITADIVVGTGAPNEAAERLKVDHGTAFTQRADARDTVELTGRFGRRTGPLSRGFLATIIEPRVMEILRVAKREIELSGYRDLIRAGYVLTGGTAMLRDTVDLAEQVLDAPVRIGVPTEVEGFVDVVKQPKYAAAVGALLYAAGGEDAGWLYQQRETSLTHRLRDTLRHWMTRIL